VAISGLRTWRQNASVSASPTSMPAIAPRPDSCTQYRARRAIASGRALGDRSGPVASSRSGTHFCEHAAFVGRLCAQAVSRRLRCRLSMGSAFVPLQTFSAIIVSRLLSLSDLLWGRTESRSPSHPSQATRSRPTRNKRRGAVVAAIAGVGLAGCGCPCGDNTDSGSPNGREKTRRPQLELTNSSFEKHTLTPWQVAGKQHARFAATRHLSWEGQRSARISAHATRVRYPVVLGQLVQRAAGAARGSRYRLVMRVRTRGLNRAVQSSIKLRYANGNFDVFPGHAVAESPRIAQSATGIPPGTSRRWITIRADAVAKRRIAAMGVYAFDSGPRPLRGTVWIDSVELFSRKAGGR
jgi:hypothetical protein